MAEHGELISFIKRSRDATFRKSIVVFEGGVEPCNE